MNQTGSFMREEARDSQPTPASPLFAHIILSYEHGGPTRGTALVSIGCPVMKVGTRLATAARTRRDLAR